MRRRPLFAGFRAGRAGKTRGRTVVQARPLGAGLGSVGFTLISCRIPARTQNGQPSLQNGFRAAIFDAISSFRDKWKLLQKRFDILTNQSLRLALAKRRHERQFLNRGEGAQVSGLGPRPKLADWDRGCTPHVGNRFLNKNAKFQPSATGSRGRISG